MKTKVAMVLLIVTKKIRGKVKRYFKLAGYFCMMRGLGGLGEWFKPAVLKTAEGKPSVSSNLTASAS
jgi:hypothetical protein